MEKIVIKNLDIKRFNALAAQSRSPAAAYMSEELEWYADSDEIVLGIVLRDTIDSDFVGIILGRDEGTGSALSMLRHQYQPKKKQEFGYMVVSNGMLEKGRERSLRAMKAKV